MSIAEIRVPDLGDFDEVDVIEVYVRVGDAVAAEDPLIGLGQHCLEYTRDVTLKPKPEKDETSKEKE